MPSVAPGVYLDIVAPAAPAAFGTGVPVFLGARGAGAVIGIDRWSEGLPLIGPTRLAVRGFFANGGERCYVTGAGAASAARILARHRDVDLVCAPDLAGQIDEQREILAACADQGCFAILDPPRDRGAFEKMLVALDTLDEARATNGAMYFPWLDVEDGIVAAPSGHVAGVYHRVDRRTGVFQAPADEVLNDARRLDPAVSAGWKARTDRVNALTSARGRGLRIAGARTLRRSGAYRHVNVRRTILAIARWLEQRMTSVVFEPNHPLLWVRVQRQVSAFLDALHAQGALAGRAPEEAYWIKCDEETNPPDVRAAGQVVTEIGVAPAFPAEFIVIRVSQGDRGVRATAEP